MATSRVLELEPTSVEEWDAEDEQNAILGTELVTADSNHALELLQHVRLELPNSLQHLELSDLAAHETPLSAPLMPNPTRYDYHLVGLPLTILIPPEAEGGRHLVRLRVTVDIQAPGGDPPVAWDLFPTDSWANKVHEFGQVGVDVGKLLSFVCGPAADTLSLKLEVPLKWTSKHVWISTSDRMSNPVDWYVTDQSINNGLTTYFIAQVAKCAPLTLQIGVVGELRRPGLLGKRTRARFRAGEQSYIVTSP